MFQDTKARSNSDTSNSGTTNSFTFLIEVDEVHVKHEELGDVTVKGVRIKTVTDLNDIGLPVFVNFVKGYISEYFEMFKDIFKGPTFNSDTTDSPE